MLKHLTILLLLFACVSLKGQEFDEYFDDDGISSSPHKLKFEVTAPIRGLLPLSYKLTLWDAACFEVGTGVVLPYRLSDYEYSAASTPTPKSYGYLWKVEGSFLMNSYRLSTIGMGFGFMERRYGSVILRDLYPFLNIALHPETKFTYEFQVGGKVMLRTSKKYYWVNEIGFWPRLAFSIAYII